VDITFALNKNTFNISHPNGVAKSKILIKMSIGFCFIILSPSRSKRKSLLKYFLYTRSTVFSCIKNSSGTAANTAMLIWLNNDPIVVTKKNANAMTKCVLNSRASFSIFQHFPADAVFGFAFKRAYQKNEIRE
jgi:hypothetical protein